jgi:hypothetical protein
VGQVCPFGSINKYTQLNLHCSDTVTVFTLAVYHFLGPSAPSWTSRCSQMHATNTFYLPPWVHRYIPALQRARQLFQPRSLHPTDPLANPSNMIGTRPPSAKQRVKLVGEQGRGNLCSTLCWRCISMDPEACITGTLLAMT